VERLRLSKPPCPARLILFRWAVIMHPEIQELVELLNATKLLLAKYGETQWSEWLAKDSLLIENLDLHGVEHLLSAYGGMGSINDLRTFSISPGKLENSKM
jgi:hypothetical protein